MKELKELGKLLVHEVGRLADANEAIVALATDQQEEVNAEQPGLPFCPHCGTFNPPVQQHAAGGGPMTEFVLAARCERCGKMLYAIPEGWQVFTTPDDAIEAIQRGGNDNGST